MADADVLIERIAVNDGGEKLIVALNRPERINAMTRAMIDRFNEALDLAEQTESVHAVVFYGAGPRGFCSGLDRAEMNNYSGSTEQSRSLVAYMYQTAKRMDVFPKPIISLVHGHCIGAGTQIAMAADLIIAADDARISEPEPRMGGFQDDDWLRRIGHVLGPVRSKRYLLMVEPVTGTEAEAIGMVSLAVSPGELQSVGHRIVDDICRMKPEIITRTLRLLDEGATGAQRAGYLSQYPAPPR